MYTYLFLFIALNKINKMQELVFCDAWVNVVSNLTLSEIAITRRVCKDWCTEGKKRVLIYKIGFDNGWYQWSGENKIPGWRMFISVSNGIVSGINSNNEEHARKKYYTGICVNSIFKINVTFPSSGQENYYEGTITDATFKGTFTLTAGNQHRQLESGGIMEGEVCIL